MVIYCAFGHILRLNSKVFLTTTCSWKSLNSHMQSPPNSLFRWCAPPHTAVRASQRSGPRWSYTGTPCWPTVNCRAGGGPSRKFGCGIWSRRMFCTISKITPESEMLYPTLRTGSPKGLSLQAWLLTCFLKPSPHPHHHHHRYQWQCALEWGLMPLNMWPWLCGQRQSGQFL